MKTTAEWHGARGVAWSTIGPATVDAAAQIVADIPHPPVAHTHEEVVGDFATAEAPVAAGTHDNLASDLNSVVIAPVVGNTVAVAHPTVSIAGFLGSLIPPMPTFPYRLNA